MDEVAIFWDYENVHVVAKGINVPLAESLIDYSESVGHTSVKKVYSNWSGVNQVITQALYSLGFEPIHVSMGKPNSVDVKLAVDCLDIAQKTPSIKYFIIVTGDKDFIPVVNWLKSHRKEVIIIGRSDIVSEHLILSANNFVSFEELSKMHKARKFSKTIISKEKSISFKEAINCLIEVISNAREQGKSTRLAIIDNFMRSSTSYNYNGASSVQKPDKKETFSSFSKFIKAAEEAGKIKTDTIEGFTEIFLLEEDPQKESEFSPTLLDKLGKVGWTKLFDSVIKIMAEEKAKNDDDYFGRYMFLLKKLKEEKKENLLPYSNNTIKKALEKLIEIGFLVKQPDSSYKLVENYKQDLDSFKDKALNK